MKLTPPLAKASRWYSKYSAPGSSGVDGWIQPWVNDAGEKAFCFVHPPFEEMGKTIRKIAYERASCILIAPNWPKYWVAALKDLPVVKSVEIEPDSAREGKKKIKESIFVKGSRASGARAAQAARWKTLAYLIRF